MTGREKFLSCMNFDEDSEAVKGEMAFWHETISRWCKEGLPCKVGIPEYDGHNIRSCLTDIYTEKDIIDQDVFSYFDFNINSMNIPVSISPGFKIKIIDENEDYIIFSDDFGIVQKKNKQKTGMPLFLEFPVKNRSDFEKIKEGFDSNYESRLTKGWIDKVNEYKGKGYLIWLSSKTFGFFGFLRHIMSLEGFLILLYDDPKLIKYILSFLTDYIISLWGYILEKVEIDIAMIWEDMAYRNGPLISPALFKEFLFPYYSKLTGFLKNRKVNNIFVDSDGDIRDLIPLWLECGINGIYPMEVQAGMDIVRVRKEFPDLKIMGGINKMAISKTRKNIDDELEKIPFMLERGGYIPTIDHSVPPTISWDNFKYYRNKLNDLIEKHTKKY